MPIWLIEIFGAKHFDGTFILILLMTAPVWFAMIYQKAMRSGMSASVELLFCWFIGAVAAIPFALSLLVRKKTLT